MPFGSEYGTGPIPPAPPAGYIDNSGRFVGTGVATSVTASTVATPAIPGASADFANTTGYDCLITMLTTGTAVAVTIKDPAGTSIGASVAGTVGYTFLLPVGWIVNLGAYTVAPTWKWQAV